MVSVALMIPTESVAGAKTGTSRNPVTGCRPDEQAHPGHDPHRKPDLFRTLERRSGSVQNRDSNQAFTPLGCHNVHGASVRVEGMSALICRDVAATAASI